MSSSNDMTDEIVEIAEQEYKRYLTISILNPDVGLSPTPLMDEMWHAHILDTMNYMNDCKRLFGKYIHHKPNFGPYSTEKTRADIGESWKNMRKLYYQLFGEYPFIASTLSESDDLHRCDNRHCSSESCSKGVCGGGRCISNADNRNYSCGSRPCSGDGGDCATG